MAQVKIVKKGMGDKPTGAIPLAPALVINLPAPSIGERPVGAPPIARPPAPRKLKK